MAKQAKKKEEHTFLSWLKRIFSAQTIGIIITILFGLVTLAAYLHQLPAKITVEYNISNKKTFNIEGKNYFDVLIPSFDGNVFLYPFTYGFDHAVTGLPTLANKSNKSVTNLRLDVEVVCEGFRMDSESLCNDFEIISTQTDTLGRKTTKYHLKYMHDILNAHTCIPLPFTHLYKADTACHFGSVVLQYSMSHEGIKSPLFFLARLNSIFDNDHSDLLKEKYIDLYLDRADIHHMLTSMHDETLVAVMGSHNYIVVVEPPKHLSNDNYEDFKKNYIQKIKSQIEIR